MSDTTDTEALTAWADALRNGLGRVRFGDLPDAEFERILETVPADDVDTLVVFAENASMSGLESIESSGPQVPRVRRAISARREELTPPQSSNRVVSINRRPISTDSLAESPAEGQSSWSSRLRTKLTRASQALLAAFAEETSALDDPALDDARDLKAAVSSEQQGVRSARETS